VVVERPERLPEGRGGERILGQHSEQRGQLGLGFGTKGVAPGQAGKRVRDPGSGVAPGVRPPMFHVKRPPRGSVDEGGDHETP
jgi:hypothetical protein